MSERDPAAIGEEIERLVQGLSALGDSAAAAQAQELVRLLMSLYGAGLRRMLDVVRTEGGGPQATLDRLGADPLVASLLVLHDLHPHPVDVRVERALRALEPHLLAGTRLTIVHADGQDVRVAVHRPDGVPASAAAGVRTAIERAIREAAPEVEAVHVDGLAERLIQITRRPQPAASGVPE